MSGKQPIVTIAAPDSPVLWLLACLGSGSCGQCRSQLVTLGKDSAVLLGEEVTMLLFELPDVAILCVSVRNLAVTDLAAPRAVEEAAVTFIARARLDLLI
jgi:hypothetical protein